MSLSLLFLFLLLFFFLFFTLLQTTTTATSPPPSIPNDAVSLLKFKLHADLDNKLNYYYYTNSSSSYSNNNNYCKKWKGIKCAQGGRVVRIILQSSNLRGTFQTNTLSLLDQLRVLSLSNNSLSGPIPNLSGLFNLKSLFLDHNSFTGSFPPSLISLHRLVTIDLSFNNLTGSIPVQLNKLDRLISLNLEFNQFNGTLPPLNQSLLLIFNVSGNNLTGPIPVTATLLKFDTSSFSANPNLCGEIINKVCGAPFFDNGNATSSISPPGPLEQSQTVVVDVNGSQTSTKGKRKTHIVILGFTIGVLVLVATLFSIFVLVKRNRSSSSNTLEIAKSPCVSINVQDSTIAKIEEDSRFESKIGSGSVDDLRRVRNSGNLVFCGNETGMYSLEQLMRASAELLGRGSIGTTYKAVLDNQLIVTVKRLDANKTAITSNEEFEQQMECVGVLRHPNLVPVRAYFQTKGERLVIYDYQPNGSLFNLIHGSRSTRTKPLHWTSCLKIAEDVAQGLAYIQRESNLVHGNLKSSNVLLGSDFEACLTDYCLSLLADPSHEDPDSASYKAPETRKSNRRATARSDVYSFGVLLFELLTGKHPSQHPYLGPADMLDWVKSVRENDSKEDDRLGMLTEVASVCRLTSPEQRPMMWQVLKMIQEIKERVTMEENASFGYS
ncbi:hypothetical protein ACFE04_000235 [Oxalis oulophora]